jgi:hypothetical protein
MTIFEGISAERVKGFISGNVAKDFDVYKPELRS